LKWVSNISNRLITASHRQHMTNRHKSGMVRYVTSFLSSQAIGHNLEKVQD